MHRCLLPLALLLLLGCPPTEEEPPLPAVPDLPTAGCGMEAYDWVPMEDVGDIVFADPAEDLSLGAGGIDILLEAEGITQFSPLPYDVRSWRVRYTTQDKGERIEATMLLSLPDVADGSSFPLVLFPHGTSGFNDECAPTFGGIEDNAIPVVVAAMGYAVIAPDYLGMNGFGAPSGFLHPYLVPEATAVASLDAARATLKLQQDQDLGAVADPTRTVLWGGSEGGFAVLWAERYASEYMPELDVVATVAMVPPTTVTGIAYAGLAEPIAATTGLAGLWIAAHSWYATPGAELSEVLVPPLDVDLPQEMLEMCSGFPSLDDVVEVEHVFQPDVIAAAAAGELEAMDPWGCYLETANLSDPRIPRTIDPPVLVIISGDDQLVVAEPVRESLPGLCDQGYDIEHLECAGASHSEGAVKSLPYQIEWVQDRLDGVPFDGGCVINEPIDCDQFLGD
jgi:acetyl esterase/lipase